MIYKSVKKTGRILVIDSSNSFCSISSEIISNVSQRLHTYFKAPPTQIALPNYPIPTSYFLTKDFYPDSNHILKVICKILEIKDFKKILFKETLYHDIPGEWFKGSF